MRGAKERAASHGSRNATPRARGWQASGWPGCVARSKCVSGTTRHPTTKDAAYRCATYDAASPAEKRGRVTGKTLREGREKLREKKEKRASEEKARNRREGK